jgi:hypothetical protein
MSIESYSLTKIQQVFLLTACGLYVAVGEEWLPATLIFSFTGHPYSYSSVLGLVQKGLIEERWTENAKLYRATQEGLALGDELARRRANEGKSDQSHR